MTDEPTVATLDVPLTLNEIKVLLNCACFGAVSSLSPNAPAVLPLRLKIQAQLEEFGSDAWNSLMFRFQSLAMLMPGAEEMGMVATVIQHGTEGQN